MTDKKFEILNREALFQGYYRMDRLKLRHERFDGGWTDGFTREIFDRGGRVAAVLPFDPKNDRVVLIEQFRAGIMLGGEYPWVTEIVAGIIEGNDSPEQTARREAVEEAGCHIYELQKVADYFVSPGCTSEHITLFMGRTAAPETGAVHGLQDEHEDIRVHVMDAAKAISLLYTNKIRDALTLVSLQWFAMHHTELRSRWLISDVGTPII